MTDLGYLTDLLALARNERRSQRIRAAAGCAFLHRQHMPVDVASVLELSGVNPKVARRVVGEHNRDPLAGVHVRGLALQHSARGRRIARGS